MIIKYCSNCFGSPYTENLDLENCPLCGSLLSTKMINDKSELSNWPKLPSGFGAFDFDSQDMKGAFDAKPQESNESFGAFDDAMYDTENRDNGFSDIDIDSHEESTSGCVSKPNGTMDVCIRGKVSQYTVVNGKSGQYRRLFLRKLWQAIKYGQRLEDVLHIFTVTENVGRDDMGYSVTNTYVVNVHGSINYGASIVDHEDVEVKGRFTHDNILMAKEVNVLNGNMSTPVKFQHSVKFIAISCVIIAILLLVLFTATGAGGSAMGNIRDFIVTMFTIYIALLVLYLIASFTRIGFMVRLLSGGRKGKTPLLTMLIISFILTLIVYNVFGIGATIGNMIASVLGAIGPIIIVIIGVVILLKAIIK